MARNSLKGIARVKDMDPRQRRNAARLANLADSLVAGVLSINDRGEIELAITSGTGLVADPNLRIDFANTPGLEVIDTVTDTGLRVKVNDGLRRDSDGLSVYLESPGSALETAAPSAGGYRFWRFTVLEMSGRTTANFTGTNPIVSGAAEVALATSEGGANLLVNPNRIWATAEEASLPVTGAIDGNLNEGNGWAFAAGSETFEGGFTYDFGAGNLINPSWLGVAGYPTANSSAAYRSFKHIKLEASLDGWNWTEIYENEDVGAWTDAELGDPRSLKWFEIPSSSTSGTVLQVKLAPDSPLVKGNDGLTFTLGDGLELGTPGITGTLARFTLDDGSGTTAEDSSVNGNDGTLIGTFSGGDGSGWSTDKPTGLSVVTGSLDFAGTDNAVNFGNPAALDFDPSVDDFSITCWSKGVTRGTLVAKTDASTSSRQVYFFIVNGGPGYVLGGGNEVRVGNATLKDDYNIGLTDGEWHHFALTHQHNPDTSTTTRVYVDGALVDERNDQEGASTNALDWLIGARHDGAGLGFQHDGLICDVRLYDSALALEQIDGIAAGEEEGVSSPVQVNLSDTDPGLEFDGSGGIQVKTKTDGGLTLDSDGLSVAAATTTVRGGVLQAGAVADLGQTISDPPTQAEVQAISDKVDELLAAMRTAEQLET